MGTIGWIVLGMGIGCVGFPLTLYLLRNVLPPTLFMPDDF